MVCFKANKDFKLKFSKLELRYNNIFLNNICAPYFSFVSINKKIYVQNQCH